MDAFLKTNDAIANLSDADRAKWEEGIGFLSQRRIINLIIDEELKHDCENEALYARIDNPDRTEIEFHSQIYYEYLNKGVIKVIDEGTENEYWDYALINRSFISFINEKGLLAIGDTLYQVTQNSIKILTDGDFSKVDDLINATVPDKEKNIEFLEVNDNLKGTSPGLIQPKEWSYNSDKDKRVIIQIYLAVLYYIPATHHYDFYHDVYVQCQEKNIFGKWKYKGTEVWVNGSWGISVFKTPLSFSNTWTYHNTGVAYLQASINPQTAASVPFQTIFGISAAYPKAEDEEYQPYFFSYNWTATRSGGCCGITSSLIKN